MTTTTRIIACLAVAATLTTGPAGAASASTPRGPETAGPAQVAPYAIPLDALGGRTLAQYVAQHHARDPRLH